ncbi:hypothetical protein DEEACLCL_00098 [Salmonella phage CRW-SP2]|nr:hypothetical protein DEEACLCL_00098 [Salmonella phage CRW-SP2]
MTTYVITGGDLLEAAKSFNLINGFAHGANCWSTMGAGIAKFVARDFPEVFDADRNDPRGPEQRLGGMSYAYSHKGGGIWGFNLYTQFYPGPNARIPSLISAVQSLFEQAHEILEADKDATLYIGFPAIGCGIGGLSLFRVVAHVNKVAASVYEDTRRRVVPVFYIREEDGFDDDLMEISYLEEDGITIVEDEAAIIEIEIIDE